MTNTMTERPTDQLPPPEPPATVPPVPAAVPPGGRRRSGWHVAAVIAGCLLLLPGLGVGAGGLATTLASTVGTDDGYFEVTLDRVESDGVAIAAIDLWDEAADDDGWPWTLDWLDVDVRLTVDGAGDSDEVFVGLARSDDVETYLEDATYSELVDIDDRRARFAVRTRLADLSGEPAVDSPRNQDFWTATAIGSGDQQLDWEARGGRWSVVVMNADGSPGVAADVEVGVHSDAVTPIGVTLLVIGGVMTLTAITLIVVGARGRRRD